MTIAYDCTALSPTSPTISPFIIEAANARRTIRLGLLGLGRVGSAVARQAGPSVPGWNIEVTCALVREPGRRRRAPAVVLTTDPEAVFGSRPDVIVEVLGGLEPARTLVLAAIARGIPVVTANKSLLAHHGEEIFEAAAARRVPVRHEASVIAGVPFLGAFAQRPHAARQSSLVGIVNGTTHFVLSQMEDGTGDYASALFEAQRRGYAEPDPSKDVRGIDAVEKLAILIRQFGAQRIEPSAIETAGIESLTPLDLLHARALGGTIKPIALAEGLDARTSTLAAFAGPAFVPSHHPLARLTGTLNGICLRDVAGSHLCFTGPGAGPDVTAVTVLDDVVETAASTGAFAVSPAPRRVVTAPSTTWLLGLTGEASLPPLADITALLGSHGVWTSRTSARERHEAGESQAVLTHACSRPRIERAAAALTGATGAATRFFRALEPLG